MQLETNKLDLSQINMSKLAKLHNAIMNDTNATFINFAIHFDRVRRSPLGTVTSVVTTSDTGQRIPTPIYTKQ